MKAIRKGTISLRAGQKARLLALAFATRGTRGAAAARVRATRAAASRAAAFVREGVLKRSDLLDARRGVQLAEGDLRAALGI